MSDQEDDRAGQYRALAAALREAGYPSVMEADVEGVWRQVLAGRGLGGGVDRVIAERLTQSLPVRDRGDAPCGSDQPDEGDRRAGPGGMDAGWS